MQLNLVSRHLAAYGALLMLMAHWLGTYVQQTAILEVGYVPQYGTKLPIDASAIFHKDTRQYLDGNMVEPLALPSALQVARLANASTYTTDPDAGDAPCELHPPRTVTPTNSG